VAICIIGLERDGRLCSLGLLKHACHCAVSTKVFSHFYSFKTSRSRHRSAYVHVSLTPLSAADISPGTFPPDISPLFPRGKCPGELSEYRCRYRFKQTL